MKWMRCTGLTTYTHLTQKDNIRRNLNLWNAFSKNHLLKKIKISITKSRLKPKKKHFVWVFTQSTLKQGVLWWMTHTPAMWNPLSPKLEKTLETLWTLPSWLEYSTWTVRCLTYFLNLDKEPNNQFWLQLPKQTYFWAHRTTHHQKRKKKKKKQHRVI